MMRTRIVSGRQSLAAMLIVAAVFSGCQMPTSDSIENPEASGLADGFYRVLQRRSESALLQPGPEQIVMIERHRFVRSEAPPDPTFVLLATAPDVPLELSRAPESSRGDDGRDRILLNFSPRAARRLAEFTTANVGAHVAIIIGGEVVTAHAIRTPLTGGGLQISC